MNPELLAIWNAIAERVRAAHDADVYFCSAPIDNATFGKLATVITREKSSNRALLILVTNGGLANSAYQIARFFQEQYEEFILFCPSRCKSAGTLIALGAHKLIMDTFSELGPLDVQLYKQNEIAAQKSGLLSASAFEALGDEAFSLFERLLVSITFRSGGNVGFKLASELSASMASTMMTPVYAQINPDVVGSEHRDLNVAMEYGRRLSYYSENATEESVRQLVRDYPSHDFIIDFKEAETLFRNVDYPSEELYELLGFLDNTTHAVYQEGPGVVLALNPIDAKGVSTNDEGAEGESEGGDTATAPMDEDRDPDRRGHLKSTDSGGTGFSTGQPNGDPEETDPTHGNTGRVRLLKE